MGLKENIKSRRTELELTLEDVARHVGVEKGTIHKYETGNIKNIPDDKLEKIAEVLDTTPAALHGWDQEMVYLRYIIKKTLKIVDEAKVAELLENYGKMSEEDQVLTLNLIKKMVSGRKDSGQEGKQ